ncbi:hypothetical protein VTP01DRAFT_8332 [Rhizomucor pusillus]|uniref:uncharacterized protein n=1 Tax=Rhizomucor pusillus TaxID=4840 RepID=UPI003742BE4D
MAKKKPLPARQLAIICISRFAEPISFTICFPFVVFMIRDFHMGDEKQTGFYVGILTSTFALCQLLTGIPWGMLSDRVGRRPILLNGLFGTMIGILMFGLSKSFYWALFCRSLCGLLNGNVGIMKSMVSELTIEHDEEQRARAFSLLPLMFGLGSIIGPVLGGLLSNPVQNYPDIFGKGGFLTEFLTEYPYFLPCFISSVITLCGLIFSYFFLEETLSTIIDASKNNMQQEQSPLLGPKQQQSDYNTFDDNRNNEVSSSVSSASTSTLTNFNQAPSLRECITVPVLTVCLTYGLFSYQAIFYDELFPIWTGSARDHGGLGFISKEIGIALAYSGCVTLTVQLFVLPKLTKRFGFVPLFRCVLFVLIFLYAVQGTVRYLYALPDVHGQTQTKFWVWPGLMLSTTIKTLCTTIAFLASTILTNNAAPRLDALGTVNGFSQCCASGMRALGPASCGIIWSGSLGADWLPYWLRIHLSWIYLSLVGIATFYSTLRLDPADYDVSKFKTGQQEIPASDDEDAVYNRA